MPKTAKYLYFARDKRKISKDEVDWIYASSKPNKFDNGGNVGWGWDEMYCTKTFRKMCGFAPGKGKQVRISIEKLQKLVEEV